MMFPSIAAAMRSLGARSHTPVMRIVLPLAEPPVRVLRVDEEDADREADVDMGWHK